jgi:hypothetical protein
MVRQVSSYMVMLASIGVLMRVAPNRQSVSLKEPLLQDGAQVREALDTARSAAEAPPDTLRREAAGRAGPWRATRRFFGCGRLDDSAAKQPAGTRSKTSPQQQGSAPSAKEPISSSQITRDVFCIGNDYAYEVAIATIPDPRRTRLGLFTDRVLENIQRGAAKAGWEYDSQWLPWQDAPDPDEKDPEKRMRERAAVVQERSEPGVLLFRHQPSDNLFEQRLLLVFVAGETPTSGINKGQFQRAHEYARRILQVSSGRNTSGPAEPEPLLRVLGPTFSGSFSSLAELTSKFPGKFDIISGTATGKGYARTFLSTIRRLDASGGRHDADRVRFASARVYDEDLNFALGQVLQKVKTPLSDFVSLVEDESGYGNSQTYARESKDKQPKFRTMFFPRDISHLRNAYREAVQDAKQKDGASQSALPFTLKDSKNGEDSLPIYAEVQTAQSQNAALQQMLRELHSSRVRLARIAATNPLDILFLVQVVHQQVPDLRLLLTTADLLLVQEADFQHIVGTLVLSPNPPVLVRSPESGPIPVEVDSTSEGVLEAVSTLLSPDYSTKLSATKPVSLNDRIWLVEATRSGFAPLAVFPAESNPNEDAAKDKEADQKPMPLPSRFWFASVNVLSFLCLGLSLTTLYTFYARTHLRAVPFWLDLFELQLNYSSNPGRAFFLAALYVCLGTMLILVLQPAVASRFSGSATLYLYAVEFVAFAAFLCLSLALICLFLRFIQALRSGTSSLTIEQKLYGIYWLLLTASAIAIEICWRHCCHGNLRFGQSYLFRYRALQLYPAASPTVPLLLTLTGVALVFFFQLRRVVWHEEASTCFPIAPLDDLPGSNLQGLYNHLCRRLFNLGVQGMNFRWSMGSLAVGVASLGLFMYVVAPGASLNTPEPRSYDWMYLLLEGVFIVLLLITCLRAFLVWRTLRGILVRLNYLPLADVFSRFQQNGGSHHVWTQTLKLPAMDTIAASTPRIHDLTLLPLTDLAPYPLSQPIDRIWAEFETARKDFFTSMTGCRDAVRRMRAASQRVAELLTRGIILPHWEATGYLPLNGQNGNAGATAASNDRAYELAVEFVVLQYISFIRYALRQLRNFGWLLSVSFLFVAFSLSSYSFQSPQMISRFLTVLFVAVGALVTIVLAQMERDAILSRLAGSKAGELNKDFVFHVMRYGALPLLGLLASLFPSVASFLFSWVQPGIEALH